MDNIHTSAHLTLRTYTEEDPRNHRGYREYLLLKQFNGMNLCEHMRILCGSV